MKTQELKCLAVVLAICLVVQVSSVKAQSTYTAPFTITSEAGSFQYGGDGTLNIQTLYTGLYFAPQFHWNPISGSLNWGTSSASGYCSTASGYNANAPGSFSSAFGIGSTASGYGSTASGKYSLAYGWISSAFGRMSTASGYASFASGNSSTASGSNSAASGYSTSASGNNSSASGYYTGATALDSFVVGSYNVGGGSSNSWVATDPLFEVGNGSASSPSDALLVDKSGNVTAKAFITTTPGGDIPMFTGSN